MAKQDAPPQKVTRDDIEHKLRELQGGVKDTVDDQKSKLLTAAAVGGIVIVLIFFFLGRRSGKKKTTLVEIRRL
jgi:hypothetical protein